MRLDYTRRREHKSEHVRRQEKGRMEKERRRGGGLNQPRQVRTAPLPVEGTPGEGGGNTGGYREAFEQDLRSDSPGRFEGGDDGFFYDQLVREREEWGSERARLLNVIEVQQREIERVRGEGREKAVEVARTFGDAVGVFEERLIGVEQGVAQEIKLLRSRLGDKGMEDRMAEMEKKIDWICNSMSGKR